MCKQPLVWSTRLYGWGDWMGTCEPPCIPHFWRSTSRNSSHPSVGFRNIFKQFLNFNEYNFNTNFKKNKKNSIFTEIIQKNVYIFFFDLCSFSKKLQIAFLQLQTSRVLLFFVDSYTINNCYINLFKKKKMNNNNRFTKYEILCCFFVQNKNKNE
jgi:hypothetical protein